MVFSEAKNNSVILQNDSLIFSVNQTFVGSTQSNGSTLLNTKNQFQVFTAFNATETETYTNGTIMKSNVTLMSALPTTLIGLLFHLLTLDSSIDIVVFISLLGFVCPDCLNHFDPDLSYCSNCGSEIK